MARLSLTAASLVAVMVAVGCKPEPKVEPLPLYLEPSAHCFDALGDLIGAGVPRSVSADLLVVDADGLADLRVDVVARSACQSFEVTGESVDIQIDAIGTILALLAGLPELPAKGRYGLVGGVYFDQADCSAGERPPFACGMSGVFGGGAASGGDADADAGPDAGDDRLRYWLLCPPTRVCLAETQCQNTQCDPLGRLCARDEQCRGGACLDDGVCRDGSCVTPEGVECLAQPCSPAATCTGYDCVEPGGSACVAGSCQDFIEDEVLVPPYAVSYPYCDNLYGAAVASQ